MPNQICVIKPYKWEGMWVFDDERVGLVREAFVAGADTIIDTALPSDSASPRLYPSRSATIAAQRVSTGARLMLIDEDMERLPIAFVFVGQA